MTDKYYMLECYTPPHWRDGRALLGAVRLPDRSESLTRGVPLKHPPAEPLQIELDEIRNDLMLELYLIYGIVMTTRLYNALIEAGVDNLVPYKTVIRHPRTGFETTDYVLCNLIGLMKVADLGKSKVVGGSPDGLLDTDFEGVEIDTTKTYGMLMFRLAENTMAVMVHESVKDHLLEKGFDMLTFVEPREWVG